MIDFVDKLDIDYLEKLVVVKKMMIGEFEDYDISKMIYALIIIDETKLSNVTNDLAHRSEGTDSLSSVSFYLFSFDHVVDTIYKQEDKQ